MAEGQLTLQYHGGGGVLAGEIGRLFFRRKDYPRQIKAVNAALKPWFHLRSARSYAQLRERLHLYFTDGCTPLALDSDEGQRLMLANAAAMNYGFAFRTATYATLRRLAAECFGAPPAGSSSTHRTTASTRRTWPAPSVVHRHNSCRAFPAELMTARHHLREHRPGGAAAGHAPHVELPRGGRPERRGEPVLRLPRRGDGRLRARRPGALGRPTRSDGSTRRFRYDDAAPAHVSHFDDRGVDAALRVLERNGLVKPVARMRPIAVLH